jgi:hypothetical protein
MYEEKKEKEEYDDDEDGNNDDDDNNNNNNKLLVTQTTSGKIQSHYKKDQLCNQFFRLSRIIEPNLSDDHTTQ